MGKGGVKGGGKLKYPPCEKFLDPPPPPPTTLEDLRQNFREI